MGAVDRTVVDAAPIQVTIPGLSSAPFVPVLPEVRIDTTGVTRDTTWVEPLLLPFLSRSFSFFSVVVGIPTTVGAARVPFTTIVFSPGGVGTDGVMDAILSLSVNAALFVSPIYGTLGWRDRSTPITVPRDAGGVRIFTRVSPVIYTRPAVDAVDRRGTDAVVIHATITTSRSIFLVPRFTEVTIVPTGGTRPGTWVARVGDAPFF